jgi:dTDP-4-amino-4,6-dideoxygalactose transaminase
MATLSFHETKNFICGEGGALLLNEPNYIERAEIIREKGTDRSRFFRGEVDKYTWQDIGSSYLPSDILAAFLYAQLEAKDMIQDARKKIWDYYYEHLADWAQAHDVQLPQFENGAEHAYHMFYMVMPCAADRDGLISHLRRAGIQAIFHYLPLHLSRMGAGYGYKQGDCPVSKDISERLVRLPFFNELTEHEQHSVVETIGTFY